MPPLPALQRSLLYRTLLLDQLIHSRLQIPKAHQTNSSSMRSRERSGLYTLHAIAKVTVGRGRLTLISSFWSLLS